MRYSKGPCQPPISTAGSRRCRWATRSRIWPRRWPARAGKTTLVPLTLLDQHWLAGRRILMLEPRRLATRAAARRMAQMLGENVGETVGYRTRLDTRVGRATRI